MSACTTLPAQGTKRKADEPLTRGVKRKADNVSEPQAADGSSGKQREVNGQPNPKKQRTVSEASALCFSELVMACTRDGGIDDQNRLVLANVGVLLSQVNERTGNTKVQWEEFQDEQGKLKELTHVQVKRLKGFLHNVAEIVKEKEGQKAKDAAVVAGWQHGVSANELLSCCGPDTQIRMENHPRKRTIADKATQHLPTKYMLRSRIRELINWYFDYMQAAPEANNSQTKTNFADSVARSNVPGRAILSWLIRTIGPLIWMLIGMLLGAILFMLNLFTGLFRILMAPIPGMVKKLYGWSMGLFTAVDSVGEEHANDEKIGPVYAALRLLITVVLSEQALEVAGVLVKLLQLRVFLCLAHSNEVLGKILHPLVWIATKVLNWSPDSKVMGCGCDPKNEADLSVMSAIPVYFTAFILNCLRTFFKMLPMPEGWLGSLVYYIDVSQNGFVFIISLLFSWGVASGLKLILREIEDDIKPKLVWMSLGLARKLREHDFRTEEQPGFDDPYMYATPEKDTPLKTTAEWEEGYRHMQEDGEGGNLLFDD